MDDLFMMAFVLAVFLAWVWVSGKNHRSRREHMDALRDYQEFMQDHWTRVEVWRAEAQEHARKGDELREVLREAVDLSRQMYGERIH